MAFEIDQRRVLAFLDVLAAEVERGALGSEGEETRRQPRRGGHDGTARDAGRARLRDLLPLQGDRRVGATLCDRDGTCTAKPPIHRTVRAASRCRKDLDARARSCSNLSPLAIDEWDVMRDHAAAGARILNQIPSLQRCAIIVRAHHERFDGAGYPDGSYGTSIPFEARVWPSPTRFTR